MSKARTSSVSTAGQPFSSRLNPSDLTAIRLARTLRREADGLRDSIEYNSVLFESEREFFLRIIRRAPSTLAESAAQLQDLAGLGPRCFEDWLRHGRRPSRKSAIAALTAIIDTADERLLDAERAHVGRWVDNPYTLDSARDLQKSLAEIIEFVRSSNSLSQIPELDEAHRRHLIDLCKVVIGLLEGPKVELGMLEQCAKWLKKLAPIVINAAVSAAVGAAVSDLMEPVNQDCLGTSDGDFGRGAAA